MLADVDKYVEIARRRTARSRLAFARKPDARPRIDTGRNLDFELAQPVNHTFAAAFLAGIFDHRPAPVASGTRPFDHEKALLRTHFAIAAAQLAFALVRAGAGARTVAAVAFLRNFDFDFRLVAVESLFERDFQIVSQIGTAPRLSATAAASAEGAAEYGFEDVADVAEIGRAAMASAKAAVHAVLERRMAETVIGRALLRILEAVIGLANGLEPRFAVAAARIFVRVIFHRQLAVGRLDR